MLSSVTSRPPLTFQLLLTERIAVVEIKEARIQRLRGGLIRRVVICLRRTVSVCEKLGSCLDVGERTHFQVGVLQRVFDFDPTFGTERQALLHQIDRL